VRITAVLISSGERYCRRGVGLGYRKERTCMNHQPDILGLLSASDESRLAPMKNLGSGDAPLSLTPRFDENTIDCLAQLGVTRTAKGGVLERNDIIDEHCSLFESVELNGVDGMSRDRSQGEELVL